MSEQIHAIEILAAAAKYTPRRQLVEDILRDADLFDDDDLEAAWLAQRIVDALEAHDRSQA